MDKFIIANGCATQIYDSLKGEKCIVLLHGYLESLEVWSDFIKYLHPSFRVIALDLPGHGVSEVIGDTHSMEFLADVVADTLRSEGVEQAYIVGHSMGGYVAMAFAERHPDMLSGIVMFHSTPYADSPEKKHNRDREIELIASGKKDTIAALFPQNGFNAENVKRFAAEIDGLAEQIFLTDDDGAMAILRGMRDREDRAGVLSSLQKPKLFIFGCKDNYISHQTAQLMIEQNPDAEVLWLENSGHMGFVEEPEKAAESIIKFCK